ncbi:MAG: hypothetical protein V4655_12845 [Bdellovibrionota bacterium]
MLSLFVSTLAKAQAEQGLPNEGLSARKRADLSGEILLDAVGFNPYTTTGIYGGYYINPNEVATLRLNQSEVADHNLNVKSLSVGWKSFWANSFFTHLGISARKFDWDWNVSRYDVSTGNYLSPEHLRSEYFTLIADLAIGNQWQLGNFTIGTEWVGFSVPLSTLGDDEVSGATTQTFSYDLNAAREDIRVSKRAQLIALRFYLGFAF